MDDTKYEQIVKKLMEFDKRISNLEDHLSGFNRHRSKSNNTPDQLLAKAIELLKQYDEVSARFSNDACQSDTHGQQDSLTN